MLSMHRPPLGRQSPRDMQSLPDLAPAPSTSPAPDVQGDGSGQLLHRHSHDHCLAGRLLLAAPAAGATSALSECQRLAPCLWQPDPQTCTHSRQCCHPRQVWAQPVFETLESHLKAYRLRRQSQQAALEEWQEGKEGAGPLPKISGAGVNGAAGAPNGLASAAPSHLPPLSEAEVESGLGVQLSEFSVGSLAPQASGPMRLRRMSARGSGGVVLHNSAPLPDLVPQGEEGPAAPNMELGRGECCGQLMSTAVAQPPTCNLPARTSLLSCVCPAAHSFAAQAGTLGMPLSSLWTASLCPRTVHQGSTATTRTCTACRLPAGWAPRPCSTWTQVRRAHARLC